MIESAALPASSYELPLPADTVPVVSPATKLYSFPTQLLARNAVWLCNLRWGAVGILLVFGVSALFTDKIVAVGLLLRSDWPLVMATVLAAANVLFTIHARLLVSANKPEGARLNVWGQMVVDLVAHTFVVHFVGSLETYALFVYIFHIFLACLFFSRLESLVVPGLVCVLFLICFGLEATGLVPPTSVYTDIGHQSYLDRASASAIFNVASAMAIWFVVWYIASSLSALLRQRNAELIETNSRLVETQEERARHLLRTTHELKAPFAAIHANTQLLLKGHCGPVTEKAHEVLLRIASRSRRLTREIQAMLQLANLRSATESDQPEEDLELDAIIEESASHVGPMAEEHKVAIEKSLRPVRVRFAREHLRMILDNLLSNAVLYSHEGGSVRVECDRLPDGSPTVTIEDHGIGIPEHKLPLIFNEYYRTDEAAQFNKESSGLGLTIVGHVAQARRVRVRVDSRHAEGTKFTLRFPPLSPSRRSITREREVPNGLSAR
ncbi:MAG: sensor histidine kinase [Planctomycetota bacterium]|jgi:signal transduction histidine kinase